MNENNFELNNATNTITENNCNLANNKKKSKKKKIIKIILIIIAAWIILNVLFIVVGLLIDDSSGSDSNNSADSTISSRVENDDSNWVKLNDTSLGYGYKKTPEDFITNINEFFNIVYTNTNDSNSNLEFYNSLEFVKKYEHDNFDEYVYAYSESGGNLGYYIDYDGTYISEAKSVVSLNVANDNPSQAKDDLCVGIVAILFAYGEIDETSGSDNCWSLVSRMKTELASKVSDYPDSTAWYFRYGDYVITYSSDEQYTVKMSAFKSNSENIKAIESTLGYTLVDVK